MSVDSDRKICFGATHPILVHHFAPIWKKLPPGSFDLVYWANREAWISEAAEFGFRAQEGVNFFHESEVAKRPDAYRVIVTSHPGNRAHLASQRGIHVFLPYSFSAENEQSLTPDYGEYDVMFCYGPHHQALFSSRFASRFVQVGYPRYDPFFLDFAALKNQSNAFGLDPDRKTILWMPTAHEFSSVPHHARAIAELTDQYNVIVKPHPVETEENIALLSSLPFTRLITDLTDNLVVFAIADHVLGDYYGTAYGAIYCDKNLLLLNVPGLDPTRTPLADRKLRQRMVNLSEPDPERLRSMLSNTEDWRTQRQTRALIRNNLFAPYYGFSSEVAALMLLQANHIARM